MRILIVGKGGREHTLAWKIAQSPMTDKLFCAPGNAGIAQVAECVDIAPNDIVALRSFAQDQKVDLTVVGPEDPLVSGLVDSFSEVGLKAFGPSGRAAELEGSKVFTKELMRKHGIPTADFRVFSYPEPAAAHIESVGAPIVVKADGLAQGKGVIVCETKDKALGAVELIMKERKFGEAGDRVIVEECLTGEEASILAFTDGKTIVPMESSQDHKAVCDDDKGPNTGGMGAYSPAPVVTDQMFRQIERGILVPTVHAMNREGRPYKGVLYAGLMITDDGPKVLEFNVRFGDPEAQPILMRMKNDLVPVLLATIEGNLDTADLQWDTRPAVCVVMASGGYPGDCEKGKKIFGLEMIQGQENVEVFHAGTTLKDGDVVSDGGRVLGVTALGDDIEDAQRNAYSAVEQISFDDAHYRKDIGAKAIGK